MVSSTYPGTSVCKSVILSDFHSVSISEALSRDDIVVAEMVANMEVDMVAGMEVEKVVNMFHICLEKKKKNHPILWAEASLRVIYSGLYSPDISYHQLYSMMTTEMEHSRWGYFRIPISNEHFSE